MILDGLDRADIVSLLIELGVDLNVRSLRGYTSLRLASDNGKLFES